MSKVEEENMTSGIVFDIRRFSVHDGPGIRTAVFLKGCPLHCLWCHNPEGISFSPEILRRTERCVDCRTCVRLCPLKIDPRAEAGGHLCKDCPSFGCCAEACPAEALQIIGRRITVSVLMEAIRADLPFYEESGGGVTFSGGEPLAQREFILALLKACKSEGIHSALDTSGFTDRDFMLEAGMLTDIVLFDLKLLDEEKHRKFTGVSNTSILTNLSALYEAGANVVLRLPLIPGINDAPEELEKMALYIGSLEAKPTELRPIEIRHTDKESIETGPISDNSWPSAQTKFLPKKAHILPYHDSAKDKYRLRRQEYAMSGTAIPSTESIDRAVSIFEAAGISVTIGG